jgi:RNA polymerase sigma factor (TIGR02999 family)
MTTVSQREITRLLADWAGGDLGALDRLAPLVHAELRRIARRQMGGERQGHTLQATALVNEAYMKLVDQRRVDWQNRAHFFAIAAKIMRRILIDDARNRLREKRGGSAVPTTLDGLSIGAPEGARDPIDLIAIDRALDELEQLDPDQARIVELRFFAGLTVEETAALLSRSRATVTREWAMAKGWLHRALTRGTSQTPTA